MGYTHYWYPKFVTDEQWKDFVSTCKKLKKALPKTTETAGGCYSELPLKIVSWDGSIGSKPVFNNEKVSFNGLEPLDHETFLIEKEDTEFKFCKTARKPYDLLVCACLIAANAILKYQINSDGTLEDWMPAIKLYGDVVYGENILNFENKVIKIVLPEFLVEQIEKKE